MRTGIWSRRTLAEESGASALDADAAQPAGRLARALRGARARRAGRGLAFFLVRVARARADAELPEELAEAEVRAQHGALLGIVGAARLPARDFRFERRAERGEQTLGTAAAGAQAGVERVEAARQDAEPAQLVARRAGRCERGGVEQRAQRRGAFGRGQPRVIAAARERLLRAARRRLRRARRALVHLALVLRAQRSEPIRDAREAVEIVHVAIELGDQRHEASALPHAPGERLDGARVALRER